MCYKEGGAIWYNKASRERRKTKMQDEECNAEECNAEERGTGGGCERAAAMMRGALLLQEKWVLMIVFSLLDGPLSFCELMRRGTINTTTLTQRLHLLEEAGLLTKSVHSAMPPRTSYALTEGGQALRPILDATAEWSSAYLTPHKFHRS